MVAIISYWKHSSSVCPRGLSGAHPCAACQRTRCGCCRARHFGWGLIMFWMMAGMCIGRIRETRGLLPGSNGKSLPSGVKTGEIQWPYPIRLDLGPLTSFGYEHEVLLLVPVTVDANYRSSQKVDLHAHMDWLACSDMCMPGRADLDLSVPLVTDPSGVTFNSFKVSFDQTRQDIASRDILPSPAMLLFSGKQWQLDIQAPVNGAEGYCFLSFS